MPPASEPAAPSPLAGTAPAGPVFPFSPCGPRAPSAPAPSSVEPGVTEVGFLVEVHEQPAVPLEHCPSTFVTDPSLKVCVMEQLPEQIFEPTQESVRETSFTTTGSSPILGAEAPPPPAVEPPPALDEPPELPQAHWIVQEPFPSTRTCLKLPTEAQLPAIHTFSGSLSGFGAPVWHELTSVFAEAHAALQAAFERSEY